MYIGHSSSFDEKKPRALEQGKCLMWHIWLSEKSRVCFGVITYTLIGYKALKETMFNLAYKTKQGKTVHE